MKFKFVFCEKQSFSTQFIMKHGNEYNTVTHIVSKRINIIKKIVLLSKKNDKTLDFILLHTCFFGCILRYKTSCKDVNWTIA